LRGGEGERKWLKEKKKVPNPLTRVERRVDQRGGKNTRQEGSFFSPREKKTKNNGKKKKEEMTCRGFAVPGTTEEKKGGGVGKGRGFRFGIRRKKGKKGRKKVKKEPIFLPPGEVGGGEGRKGETKRKGGLPEKRQTDRKERGGGGIGKRGRESEFFSTTQSLSREGKKKKEEGGEKRATPLGKKK